MKCRPFIVVAAVSICSVVHLGCGPAPSYIDVVLSKEFSAANEGIKRVGIVDFSFARPQAEQMGLLTISRPLNAGEIVADAMADLPLRLGYDVIERKQLAVLLQEKDLSAMDLLKPGTGSRIGKTLGIQAVVLGTVNEFNFCLGVGDWYCGISFSARMVRLDTGQVLWTLKCERAAREGQVGIWGQALKYKIRAGIWGQALKAGIWGQALKYKIR